MKVAIIGAGASGLACAVSLIKKVKENNLPLSVTVFEAIDKAGKKILATGNGRCNLMNKNEGDYYFCRDGFVRFALNKYNVKSNLDFFASLGLYTRSDEEGRIYPLSNQASGVLDALRLACEGYGVKLVTDYTVNIVKKENGKFIINNDLCFDKLVLACGGKAAVKKFNGYELLDQLGHNVTKVYPSLTKLEVRDSKLVKPLKGIRQKGVFTLYEGNKKIATEKGELLFTDYGISGIAVMQLSAFAVRCKGDIKINADFVNELTYEELVLAIERFARNSPGLINENLLSGLVSKRLGWSVLKASGISLDGYSGLLTKKEIKMISSRLKSFEFIISGYKGFEEAQVTAGGADTALFKSKTMESVKVKGLYCIGELLDVDGLCGGYNLHWAWSSGRLCADSIINEQLSRKG